MTVALPRDGAAPPTARPSSGPPALGQQLRWEFGRAAQNGGGGGGGGADAPDMSVLQTEVPKWNARSDSFELPFHGRANQARRPPAPPPHARVVRRTRV